MIRQLLKRIQVWRKETFEKSPEKRFNGHRGMQETIWILNCQQETFAVNWNRNLWDQPCKMSLIKKIVEIVERNDNVDARKNIAKLNKDVKSYKEKVKL